MNLLKDNWTYAKVSDFAELLRGISYKKDESRKESQKGYKPMLRSNNINYELNFIDLVYVPEKKIKSIQFIKEGDIIFAMSSGSKHLVGKSAQSKCNYDGSYGAFCGLLRVSNLMNKKYVGLFFKSQEYRKYISRISKGTNINNLKRDHILEIDFPLAPLNEQNRIVEKIEEIFSDLDKATEDLKKTQEQLKIYRQAVLKAAFEGKLLEMGLAKYSPFSEVCDINPSKQEIVKLNDDLEVTFLPMLAVSETGVILEKKIKILKDVKKGYTFFKNGDVLLAKITPCFENGKKAIVKELKNNIGFGSTEFHVLRPKEEVISEWIYYGISLEDFRNKAKSQMTGTAGQKRVPKRVLESYAIPIPTKPIQEKILQEIESRLSVCDKLEETIEQSLKKMEYLRQSILKKAFEGKLVPQDPNDLPVCELLKQIKIKKDKMSKNGK